MNGVVAMVDEEAQFGAAGAAGDVGEGRCAEAEASVQVANFVAETNFGEAVEAVSRGRRRRKLECGRNHQRVGALVNLELAK